MTEKELITIDGSQGEGGGQVLRSSLTLSLCLGVPIRVKNIRAGRAKPGLLRQHLTSVKAAVEISDGEVSGAELRSSEIMFTPGEVKSGSYRFQIGSAGGTTLVFQTIFLPLAMVEGESTVYLEGGTHNGMSPSYDFISECFLPVMKRFGIDVRTRLDHFGFYPAGGGAWKVTIKGGLNQKQPLRLIERGDTSELTARATSAKLPAHITQRELAKFKQKLNLGEECLEQRLVKSVGPGNIVSVIHRYDGGSEMVEVVGEKHVTADKVANKAIKQFDRFYKSEAAVGEHLADQLILPMALGAGGRFTTIEPSMHLLTNIDVVKSFLPVDIECKKIKPDLYEVIVKK